MKGRKYLPFFCITTFSLTATTFSLLLQGEFGSILTILKFLLPSLGGTATLLWFIRRFQDRKNMEVPK